MTHQERVNKAADVLADHYRNEIAKAVADEMVTLDGYVVFLLNAFNLWSPEGVFAFPDGQIYDRKEQR